MSTVVTLTGNITREPEYTVTPSGTEIVKIGLAVNDRRMKNGEWVDGEPSFFNLVAFNGTGKNILDSGLTKGHRVMVVGKLNVRTYERNDDAKSKGTSVDVVIDEIGPSLRWQTVQGVTKNERNGNGKSGAGDQALEDAYLS